MNIFKKNVAFFLICTTILMSSGCASRTIKVNEPISSGRDVNIENKSDEGDVAMKKGYGAMMSMMGVSLLLAVLVGLATIAEKNGVAEKSDY